MLSAKCHVTLCVTFGDIIAINFLLLYFPAKIEHMEKQQGSKFLQMCHCAETKLRNKFLLDSLEKFNVLSLCTCIG